LANWPAEFGKKLPLKTVVSSHQCTECYHSWVSMSVCSQANHLGM